MILYEFNANEIKPEELANLLGLTYNNDQPGPYSQFYRDRGPVGYIVRSGLISLSDEIQIPAGLPLKRL